MSGKRHEAAVGDDGHLLDPADWSEDWARAAAAGDGIELDSRRWWVVRFVRQHYMDYGTPPLMRVLVAAMRREAGIDEASSRTLYRLFPDGPIRSACRYAGLPRPEACI